MRLDGVLGVNVASQIILMAREEIRRWLDAAADRRVRFVVEKTGERWTQSA